MRQRKLKNLEARYEGLEDVITEEPAKYKGNWSSLSGGRPIYIEVGCGKGKFISELAAKEQQNFFVAIEGNKSVMLRAVQKIKALGLSNVIFVPLIAGDLGEWFEEGEASGIYLNFSDPHPKNYQYKRRLTYRDRLRSYFAVLGEGGRLTFKTDNTDLFEWSLLEIASADLKIADITRDLHADPDRAAENIETEYEAKYSGMGETIKRVIIERAKVSEDLTEEKGSKMADITVKSIAAYNGREIPKEDKVFAASGAALDAVEKYGPADVINSTVGALYDDDGELIVFKSIAETTKNLPAKCFAAYGPIGGIPAFKDAILKAALCGYEPKSYTAVLATPGGAGAIRNAIANYSQPGDRILTHSWHWAPYKSISNELYRDIEHFEMFDDEGKFNVKDFEYKIGKLIRNQEHLVIILNTPASNPTGYSVSMDEWNEIKRVLDAVPMDKKVALVLDVAYIDYAGEPTEVRGFLKVLDNLRANILPIIAYSASKTFTFYGSRCAAMICMAHNPEIAEEFIKINSYSSRASWSNPPRPPQEVIARIYADEDLLAEVEAERASAREMLLARGRAFEKSAKECGLEIVPFSAGFFVTIPCDDPDGLCAKLAKKNVFLIPLEKGVRVSVASASEEKCGRLPLLIKEAMDE